MFLLLIDRGPSRSTRPYTPFPYTTLFRSVTGVAAGTSATAVAGNVGAALGGSYGSLTLAAGGGYTYTLSNGNAAVQALGVGETLIETFTYTIRSEEHTSELQSLMRISYDVLCLQTKINNLNVTTQNY